MAVTFNKIILLPLKIKMYLIAAVVLIIFLVGYTFLLKPKFESLQTLHQKNMTLTLTLAQQQLTLKKLIAEQRTWEQIASEHQVFLNSFAASLSLTELMSKIMRINQKNYISTQLIAPQKLIKTKLFYQQTVQLSLTGNYDNFCKWLQESNTLSLLVVPAEFVIKSSVKNLLINVTLVIYGPRQ